MNLKSDNIKVGAALFAASLAYFLFFCRFDILFQDEGYFNLACTRILAGELPYKDFALLTPPISYFFQTLIFKIFGSALIVGRITTALLGSFITVLIFLISSRISSIRFSIIPAVLFIFWGTAHIPYPSFNWFGLLFGLVVALLFIKSIETGFKPYIIFSGFLSGFLLFTKQNLGVAVFAAACAFFILERILKPKETMIPDLVYYVLGAIAGLVPVINHAYTTGILPGMMTHVFNYGYKSGMMRADFFPFPHIVSVTLLVAGIYAALGAFIYQAAVRKRAAFGIGLAVISAGLILACYIFRSSADWGYILDHIKKGVFNGFFNLPMLSILSVFAIYSARIIRKNFVFDRTARAVIFLAIFALLYAWAGILISRDFVHLIPTMPVAYILYGFLLEKMSAPLGKKFGRSFTNTYCIALPVILLCASGLIANLKNETFRFSSYPLTTMTDGVDVPKAKYILANPQEVKAVEGVVAAVGRQTGERDKIFCLYACETFYILAERQPASFYTFFAPSAFSKNDQKRVISDLDANNVKLVVARRDLMGVSHGGGIAAEIEKYVHDRYDIKETIGDYNIFIRKRSG